MATAIVGRAEEPLDTTVRMVTPERITFSYPLAGPFRRALAYLLDQGVWLFLFLGAAAVLRALALGAPAGMGLVLVAYFVLQWGYGGFCEATFNGQTPGKRVMGLRVVSEQGVPITGGQAALRNLLWAVEWAVPFAFLPALASMLLTRRFQRLGDLAAGTMVVVEDRPARGGMPRVDEPAVSALLPLLPARVGAGPELARALSDYVACRARFARPRREEMAAYLAGPLRDRFGLPAEAAGDAILCALYRRVLLGD
jgi:uncharacterized RDD family membrane protein YckC